VEACSEKVAPQGMALQVECPEEKAHVPSQAMA
jgi:hypothetical protein